MDKIKDNLGKIIFLIAVLLAILGYTQYAELACKFADNPELCLQEIAQNEKPQATVDASAVAQ
jgi:hypothetical protein